MFNQKLIYFFLFIAFSLCNTACNKDDDQADLPDDSGNIELIYPSFFELNDRVIIRRIGFEKKNGLISEIAVTDSIVVELLDEKEEYESILEVTGLEVLSATQIAFDDDGDQTILDYQRLGNVITCTFFGDEITLEIISKDQISAKVSYLSIYIPASGGGTVGVIDDSGAPCDHLFPCDFSDTSAISADLEEGGIVYALVIEESFMQ